MSGTVARELENEPGSPLTFFTSRLCASGYATQKHPIRTTVIIFSVELLSRTPRT